MACPKAYLCKQPHTPLTNCKTNIRVVLESFSIAKTKDFLFVDTIKQLVNPELSYLSQFAIYTLMGIYNVIF